ncbi:MAG TPA: TonB-dependent receptor [Blastocatellia bacterium]|nr:TonB-dependent receptor [Blastocatellia bacterium]
MNLKQKTLREAVASLLTTFLLLSFSPVAAFAQTETGQITVRATDPQGAVVSGAMVSVKSTATSAERTATTNEEGNATITNLQPGVYDVTVTGGSGFAPYKQQAQIMVGAKLTIDATLSPTGTTESVTVVAGESGVEVNTQSQQLADTISQKQITELPTLTRNPYALVGISGNATDVEGVNARGTGFSINGQRSASTNILLDGGENVDTFTATVGQNVPLDSVQEFQVITSNFSSEYGRASGGIVNVATRAGSNAFHGSLYAFNRVSALASNGFDNNANNIPKGVFTRNQFGYSVGGRIIKDKLFFFSSTEWTRVRSTGEEISLVPTAQLLAASNANTQNYFNAFQLANPINGQILSVNQVIDQIGRDQFFDQDTGAPLNSFAALAGGLPAFGQVRVQRAQDLGGGPPVNDWQTVARVDYNWSDRTQIYFRAAFQDFANPFGTVSFSPYTGFNTGQDGRNQNYLTSVTHSFSSNLVSQTKVVFNRLNLLQPLGDQPLVPTLFMTDAFAGQVLNGNIIRLPGYLSDSPGNGIPFGGPQNFLQLYQDLNWTRGNHQLRMGGQYVHIRDNRTFGAYEYADARLGNTQASALGNLIDGQLARFTVAVFPQGKFPCSVNQATGALIQTPECTLETPLTQPNFSRSNRYHEWAAYFNDSWKIKPRLTLNLGLRYEYYGTQHNADQSLDSNFYFGEGANRFEQIRNGRIMLAQDSPIGKLWAVDKNNFAPRVGLAWDVFGSGKTSLRGGYGMAYERNFGNVTFNVIQNPPNYATIAVNKPTDIANLPITLENFGPVSGSGISKAFPATSLRVVDPNIVNAYAHFWSGALQHQLMSNTIVSAEYTGSAGRSLYSIANINRDGSGHVYLGDARAFNRLNLSGPSSINFRGSDGRSNYNALILSLDSNNLANKGVRMTARYTFSNAKDNLSDTFSSPANQFNLGYLDPFNPDLDYGYADFDVRHRFTSTFVWDIPHVSSAKGFLNQVVNGWELTGIINLRTGTPFSIYDSTNAFNAVMRAQLNGAVNSNGSVDRDSGVGFNRYNFIDLSGLSHQFTDSVGLSEFPPFPADMSERNAFRRPGFWNVDSAVYKNFKVTERVSLQLRFEAYNVFNHANLYVSGGEADIGQGSFVPACYGRPECVSTNTAERRNVQIAGKIIF